MSPASHAAEGSLGSFANVDTADPADLVHRLDAMHMLDFFRAYKHETFGLLGLAPGDRVADVGCGTGDDARNLAAIVGAAGTAVGFDLSDSMLAEARSRHAGAQKNLRFIRAAADDLGVEAAAFDAIRADRVLTHVPDPAAAIREMVRALKPGGRIVVSEPDMPGCWATSNHHAISEKILRSIAMSCQQPYAARDLYHLFLDAGIGEVHLALRPVAISDPEPVENILRFAATAEAMVGNGELGKAEAGRWHADFEERRRRGRFLAGMTMFIVAGRKPGGPTG